MSSMKKNALAAALVAGLGLAGAAAAYTYGTDPVIAQPEPVAYQVLSSADNYDYIMREALVFDIDIGDNIVGITTGFTVRVRLKDGALFDSAEMTGNTVQAAADGNPGIQDNTSELVLNPGIQGWTVQLDGFDEGGAVAVIRVFPTAGAPIVSQISPGRLLTWHDVKVTDLNELATGSVTTVNGDFWMVNSTNDAMFVNSFKSAPVLTRTSAVTACANATGADINKYIDVADNWLESQKPKTRFSFDGRLGSAVDGQDINSQWINLGQVSLTNSGAGGFTYQSGDQFTTVLTGDSGGWEAFDNDTDNSDDDFNDDVYLYNGSCASGSLVATGEVEGTRVTFQYTAGQAGLTTGTQSLSVCAYADSDVVINDQHIAVSTTFFRADAIETPAFNGAQCALLPLRYNGSTMEIFTINPAVNDRQRSFVRLTNRSATAGYVRLEGFDDAGAAAPGGQVSVWLDAGESVQLTSVELENGGGADQIGAWGAGTGKWRAVVTAEFPGLVASSYVRNTIGDILSNITDSDTRGEQYNRDYSEGTFASEPSERPSDFVQETTPDFRGNNASNGIPGGPNGAPGVPGAADGPRGGTTAECGNPGIDGSPLPNCPGLD